MKKRRLLAGLMSLAVVASLGSCEKNHDQNSDASSGIVSTENGDSQTRKIYDLYKENGGTLTYEEWLASIKGEKGDKGDKGDTGVTGADGSSVRTGSGVPDIGLGKDGDSYIDMDTFDYYLKINGAWTKVGNIKGSDGERGDKGDKGDKGDTGEQGVAGVSVSSITKTSSEGNVDTYTIIYSDGTTTTFTVTNGENGADGADGAQGIQGVPGADGHTPVITIGKNGNWTVDGVDTGIAATGAKGDKGEKGDKGDKGDTGEQGVAGVSVSSITKTSSEGNVDTYTITYSDGTTTTFTVTNGENGVDGADGAQGIQGVPGADGHTPVITIGGNGNWFVDGVDTGIAATGAKGEKGDKGDKGDKGETGADGNDAPHYGETHTVTYYPNGGTMPSDKSDFETVTWGDCLDLPVPTRPGYTFSGWLYEGNDVNDPSRQWTNRDAVFKDITLTAHWETATYTISPTRTAEV